MKSKRQEMLHLLIEHNLYGYGGLLWKLRRQGYPQDYVDQLVTLKKNLLTTIEYLNSLIKEAKE